MGRFHADRFPGESDEYREARDRLLEAEMGLRAQIEDVAALRRKLPSGGPLKEEYLFDEGAADLADETTITQTRFSDLFTGDRTSLVLYSFMFLPGDATACPMCTSFLDSLNGSAPHIRQRVDLAVVAKAPIAQVRQWARGRGWTNLRLLSSGGNSFNNDYLAERADGSQLPVLHVFRKTADGLVHFYSTEMIYAPAPEGMNPRHVDSAWPLWNVFDLTPEGRGTGWYPSVSYD